MSILNEILKEKEGEIARKKRTLTFEEIKRAATSSPAPRGFIRTLKSAAFPAIIAEIKRKSPSKGNIRSDLEPRSTALAFKDSGATCLSVLTDEPFFAGKLEYLSQIRDHVPGIPLLRKDFIIDPYQIWESRLHGADAILLIVRALTEETLQSFYKEARNAALDLLIEVHDEDELRLFLNLACTLPNTEPLPLLGINNRNLDSFVTDLQTTEMLLRKFEQFFVTSRAQLSRNDLLIVSESGILTGEDILRLAAAGIDAFLVGESLLRKGEPGANLTLLMQQARKGASR